VSVRLRRLRVSDPAVEVAHHEEVARVFLRGEREDVVVEAGVGEVGLQAVAPFVRRGLGRGEVADGGEQVVLETQSLVNLQPQVVALRVALVAGNVGGVLVLVVAGHAAAAASLVTHARDQAVALQYAKQKMFSVCTGFSQLWNFTLGCLSLKLRTQAVKFQFCSSFENLLIMIQE